MKPRRSLVREYGELMLVVLIIFLFTRPFVVQFSETPTGSMEDTILAGDHILINRWLYAPVSFDWERAVLPIRDVRRGDVVKVHSLRRGRAEAIEAIAHGTAE